MPKPDGTLMEYSAYCDKFCVERGLVKVTSLLTKVFRVSVNRIFSMVRLQQVNQLSPYHSSKVISDRAGHATVVAALMHLIIMKIKNYIKSIIAISISPVEL